MFDKYLQQVSADLLIASATSALSRRHFVTMTVGGAVGLAFMPLATTEARAQQAPASSLAHLSALPKTAPPPCCATAWTWAKALKPRWP
jgi:hypothetical protein